jgi:hypothetical protein
MTHACYSYKKLEAHRFIFLCCGVFLCFVCLLPVSCVPDVASVSGLVFSVVLCFVFCLSSPCVLCAQCCQRLWISFLCCGVFLFFVCLHPLSCVPNVASVSGSVFCVVLCFCVLFVFTLCLVCPMLPASLDQFSVLCCVFVFCLSSPCVLCAQCCQRLWICFLWLLLQFSLRLSIVMQVFPLLTRIICSQLIYYIMARPYIYFCTSDIVEERKTYIFISHFQCAGLMVLRCLRGPASLDWFSVLCCVFVFCLSSPCVLCAQCCQRLWICFLWLLLQFSLRLSIVMQVWKCVQWC